MTKVFYIIAILSLIISLKIPLLIFESTALGYSFSMLRLGLNIVGIAFIISVFLKEKDKEEIYSLAQERE